MSKINISLPDELLVEIDGRAAAANVTRSAFVREATASYIASLDEKSEDEERTRRVRRALDKMRSVAPSVGSPDSAKVIRELRDAAPRWERR
jgi:metal-responsive CopG/Arc/MetJ family transcriptional regulator